ncbi:MAG: aminotransferase class I/II-fold pyridoxal phosphate-dependent enzyme, partial [Lachnospiraceae bacterium]|nr:aminotransferase class I/II-fold pyridoxal phosphate-dependent enzyme [Lachnospiraceae bacterium]
EETGRAIFADPLREKYLEDSGRLILRLRSELEEHLQNAGIDHIPSESNFVLLNTDRDLYNELLEKKILIRDCRNVRGLGANWYRIAAKEPAGSIVF